MKKLTLILGIVLLVGCSKESYYEFITQRIDTIYHKNIILKIIPKTPIYTIHYDISKKKQMISVKPIHLMTLRNMLYF